MATTHTVAIDQAHMATTHTVATTEAAHTIALATTPQAQAMLWKKKNGIDKNQI
jgi:hypothetical protein